MLITSCATQENTYDLKKISSTNNVKAVRHPEVGQFWKYQVRDKYKNQIVDEITETVVSVSPDIVIQRISKKNGKLPNEVQTSWGEIKEDPHWQPEVVFQNPDQIWPKELLPGKISADNQYSVVDDPFSLYSWHKDVEYVGWESITTRAGKFNAFHIRSNIRFESNEFYYKKENKRFDDIWFVPEIGRWVLRVQNGTFLIPGRGGTGNEDYLAYELIEWK
ncbi:hypothetical protein FERRO_07130 [Ferrovum sp. JA12]|nr:hypothetical protein FERRO_07130 [Ferrovum sp. JA12]